MDLVIVLSTGKLASGKMHNQAEEPVKIVVQYGMIFTRMITHATGIERHCVKKLRDYPRGNHDVMRLSRFVCLFL